MGKRYKYVYDLNARKIIKKRIYEDDNNIQTDTTQTQQQQQTNNTQQQQTISSIDGNEDIQKIEAELRNLTTKYQNDITAQNKLLQVAKVNASKKPQTGPYDPAQVDPQVLQILKKINELDRQFANNKANIIDKRLQVLQGLSKTNENWYNLPERYKGLNESNLNSAKVYVNTLVGNDSDQILRNMHDFKRVLKNTDLLYGKDRKGYFVVAIDGEDLNKLSDTLEEQGYLRDDILDAIMPQILDRSSMIK